MIPRQSSLTLKAGNVVNNQDVCFFFFFFFFFKFNRVYTYKQKWSNMLFYTLVNQLKARSSTHNCERQQASVDDVVAVLDDQGKIYTRTGDDFPEKLSN